MTGRMCRRRSAGSRGRWWTGPRRSRPWIRPPARSGTRRRPPFLTAVSHRRFRGPVYRVRSEQIDLLVGLDHPLWIQRVDTRAARRGEQPFGSEAPGGLLHKRVRYEKTARVLAIKAGISANVRVDDRVGLVRVMPNGQSFRNLRPTYVVSLVAKRNRPLVNHGRGRTSRYWNEEGYHDGIQEYSGGVHSVAVPCGLLVVRRSGKVVVSGAARPPSGGISARDHA